MRLFHLCVRAWNDKQTYFNSFALRYGHKKVIFWSLISSISIKNIVLKCVFYWGKKLWRVPFFTLRLGLGHVKFLTLLIQFTRQKPRSALYWAEMKNERKRALASFFSWCVWYFKARYMILWYYGIIIIMIFYYGIMILWFMVLLWYLWYLRKM